MKPTSPSPLPAVGSRDSTGQDATDEVNDLFTNARKDPNTAAAIETKRAELDTTLTELRKRRGRPKPI